MHDAVEAETNPLTRLHLDGYTTFHLRLPTLVSEASNKLLCVCCFPQSLHERAFVGKHVDPEDLARLLEADRERPLAVYVHGNAESVHSWGVAPTEANTGGHARFSGIGVVNSRGVHVEPVMYHYNRNVTGDSSDPYSYASHLDVTSLNDHTFEDYLYLWPSWTQPVLYVDLLTPEALRSVTLHSQGEFPAAGLLVASDDGVTWRAVSNWTAASSDTEVRANVTDVSSKRYEIPNHRFSLYDYPPEEDSLRDEFEKTRFLENYRDGEGRSLMVTFDPVVTTDAIFFGIRDAYASVPTVIMELRIFATEYVGPTLSPPPSPPSSPSPPPAPPRMPPTPPSLLTLPRVGVRSLSTSNWYVFGRGDVDTTTNEYRYGYKARLETTDFPADWDRHNGIMSEPDEELARAFNTKNQDDSTGFTFVYFTILAAGVPYDASNRWGMTRRGGCGLTDGDRDVFWLGQIAVTPGRAASAYPYVYFYTGFGSADSDQAFYNDMHTSYNDGYYEQDHFDGLQGSAQMFAVTYKQKKLRVYIGYNDTFEEIPNSANDFSNQNWNYWPTWDRASFSCGFDYNRFDVGSYPYNNLILFNRSLDEGELSRIYKEEGFAGTEDPLLQDVLAWYPMHTENWWEDVSGNGRHMVVGARVVGLCVVGGVVDGAAVVGDRVVGLSEEGGVVDGARVDGARVGDELGVLVVGVRVLGATVVGDRVVGLSEEGGVVDGDRVDGVRVGASVGSFVTGEVVGDRAGETVGGDTGERVGESVGDETGERVGPTDGAAVMGESVGTLVGETEGARVMGDVVGPFVGLVDGDEVGSAVVGARVVGAAVGGKVVGAALGVRVGETVGFSVGPVVGLRVGTCVVGESVVGDLVGRSVGVLVGLRVGTRVVGESVVGDLVGRSVGVSVGVAVGEYVEGERVGGTDGERVVGALVGVIVGVVVGLRVGVEELGEAVTVIVGVVVGFRVGVEELGEAVTVIVGVVVGFRVGVEELGEAVTVNVGAVVGRRVVGARVGDFVAVRVGLAVVSVGAVEARPTLGEGVTDCVGLALGVTVGDVVGAEELGVIVGGVVGAEELGETVGGVVGAEELGETVGDVVGAEELGETVGGVVGAEELGETVGDVVGAEELGEAVGCVVVGWLRHSSLAAVVGESEEVGFVVVGGSVSDDAMRLGATVGKGCVGPLVGDACGGCVVGDAVVGLFVGTTVVGCVVNVGFAVG
ncbi:hypothetical protein CYMTET_38611 [Cymbomonas tetramitiformis]|uniref:Uncharacterized protein n=1 Tax=Cymbomonas tetramitiformis TaxID=36881 RepID=A0AAE0F527_9CHLO|nr:hypothetical protein CYMTET_38611 [Cymbomonas tetramitiformis]